MNKVNPLKHDGHEQLEEWILLTEEVL